MTSRRGIALIAGVVAAAVVVTLIVVVAGAESPPSASEALDRAQRFANRADSVEYRGESRLEFEDEPPVPPEDGGFDPNSSFEESAVFPDQSRSVLEFADLVTETIAIDDVTYDRSAEDRKSLDDELWTEFDPDAIEDEEPLTEGGFVGGGLFVAPTEVPALVEASSRPRILSQDNGETVIRADLDSGEFEEIYYTSVTIDLAVEDDGRITEIHLVGSDEYETQRVNVEIERWNDDLRIEAPADADIDPTPNLDEEDIAAYDAAALFQPRLIPTGWVLQTATIIPEGEFGLDEEAGCDQVDLYFTNEALFESVDEEDVPLGATYLDLFEFPTSCAEDRPRGADDFTAGTYTGWFEDEEGYLYGQIAVGDTVIEFSTDLSEEALAAILADLVALDFANPPAATLPSS
ncbi:MAG: hypothetical protein ACT4PI_12060 [Actinomycetota bacterium]